MAIKVILRQDVPNLGAAGEVKQVAPGYFRNFLAPRGLAVEATKGQLKSLEHESKHRAGAVAKDQARASAVAQGLGGVTIRIPVKLGEQGRIYGSVTNKDISEALAQQADVVIDRHRIELGEPLKALGIHSVPVKFEHGVEGTVTVELVPESETAAT